MKKRVLSYLLIFCLGMGLIPKMPLKAEAASASYINVDSQEGLEDAFATRQTNSNGELVTTRISLTKDIVVTDSVFYGVGPNSSNRPQSVQLDLNGHNIIVERKSFNLFKVGFCVYSYDTVLDDVEESSLEIINSNKSVKSKISGTEGATSLHLFAVYHNGIATIGGEKSGPIEISGFVNSAIQIGNIDNYKNLPTYKATAHIKSGVTIKDCKYHSSGKKYGGALFISTGGQVNLYDGATIEGCSCCKENTSLQDEGGGVYVAGTFNMYGGTIKNCVAQSSGSRGGGVYVATGGTFNMYDGLITENRAAAGGGVGLWGGHFNMYGGEIKNNYASNCGNEIAMLYGTEDISATVSGGKITHEESYSGCGSQIYVNGKNSKMQILTGSEIMLDGQKNGFGGSGDVIIKGGYLKVQGLSSAFTKVPTLENMDVASGDRNAEKLIASPTKDDFFKPGVILGEKGKLNVTVTFAHPIMSGFTPNTTPPSVTLVKGTCLSSLPVVSDTQGRYFYAGWINEYESFAPFWSLSTPVYKNITLTSQWNQYNVYFKDSANKPVEKFDFETTYGYTYNASSQIIISNQNAPVILQVENSYKYFEVSQFYAGGKQGYTYTLPSSGQCGLYITPKADVDAGTYSENIIVKMSADGNDYSAERAIPVTLVVKKAKLELTSAPIADLSYGQTLEEAVLTGGKATQYQYFDEETKSFICDVPGKFTFADGSIKPGIGNSQPFDIVFTPDAVGNYEELTGKGYAYVSKLVIKDLNLPTVDYSIEYGTPLSDIPLPTGWNWEDENIVPKPGTTQQTAYFEFEEDLSNYDFSGSNASDLDFEKNRVNKKISIKTDKQTPIVSEPTASSIKQGQKLSDSVLSGGKAIAFINDSEVDVPGTFSFKEPDTAPSFGEDYYTVVFTPDDTDCYEIVETEVSVKTVQTFTVAFIPDNGTAISSQIVAIGEKITEPSAVTKEGYAFLGWYKGDTKWDFDNDTVTENISLKAKWKDTQKPVIIDLIDGKTYCAEVKLEVSDNDGIASVKVGSDVLTADSNGKYTLEAGIGKVTVVVTDKSNNFTEVSVTVNDGHTFGQWQSNGDSKHTHYCTVDGCDGYETENCSGGEASYFKKAVCEECKEEYGELLTDLTAPTGEIEISENKWNSFLNTITFGLFFKDTQSVTISASDDSYSHAGYTDDKAVKVEYYLYSGDTALTEADLANKEFTAISGEFSINPDNKYVVYARLTDHAGNVTYISSDGVVSDATAPVISGIESGKTYCSAQTVTIVEDYIASVTVNDEEVLLDENNWFTLSPADGEQTIVVTDKAGNTAEMIVTVNDGHNFEWQSEYGQYWRICTICGDETTKKDIPEITIDGADSVYRTEDYKFSFTLPEGVTSSTYGYEFENKGDAGLEPTIEDGKISAIIPANTYEPSENSFTIFVEAITDDGFAISVSKTIIITSDGDIDSDEEIKMLDVVLVQKAIAKLVEFTSEQVAAADVNRDKKITMVDVVLIQRYIAGLITSFD